MKSRIASGADVADIVGVADVADVADIIGVADVGCCRSGRNGRLDKCCR
jgi:hypothetical protein